MKASFKRFSGVPECLVSKRMIDLYKGGKFYEKFQPLVDGILLEGDILMISGEPRIGKSFMLMELAEVLVSGGNWMGSKASFADVLFVNTHLKKEDFCNRCLAIHRNINPSKSDEFFGYYFSDFSGVDNKDSFFEYLHEIVSNLTLTPTCNDGSRGVIIVDNIDDIGFSSADEFAKKYIQAIGPCPPTLVFGTCQAPDETHVPDSVISINPFIGAAKDDRKRVTAEFAFRNLPPKQLMCGVFNYPVFNWKPAENHGDGIYGFAE